MFLFFTKKRNDHLRKVYTQPRNRAFCLLKTKRKIIVELLTVYRRVMNIILMDRRGWGTICTTSDILDSGNVSTDRQDGYTWVNIYCTVRMYTTTDILDSGNVSTDRRDGYTWVNFCCIQYVYSIQYILYTVYSILYVQHICTMYNTVFYYLLCIQQLIGTALGDP